MPVHVFVDENKTRGLLMAAALCRAGEVSTNRKALRGLLLPGQERLHFSHEKPARRKLILEVISGFRLVVDLYKADRDDLANRTSCLEAIVRDNARTAERLIIERDESTLESDRRTVNAATHRFGCHGTLRYDLLAPKADPLLWVPDAVVWSWIRGGDWRRSVAPFCQLREL